MRGRGRRGVDPSEKRKESKKMGKRNSHSAAVKKGMLRGRGGRKQKYGRGEEG